MLIILVAYMTICLRITFGGSNGKLLKTALDLFLMSFGLFDTQTEEIPEIQTQIQNSKFKFVNYLQ